jgi:hypothetical protein
MIPLLKLLDIGLMRGKLSESNLDCDLSSNPIYINTIEEVNIAKVDDLDMVRIKELSIFKVLLISIIIEEF